MPEPGIFRLEPVFLPKVWAAPELQGGLGPVLKAPARTGEVWLASSRHSITKAASGPHKGLGLDEITAQWGKEILGREPEKGQGFPLLLKILSVGQWLSVQVHPDDADAARLEGEPWGKTEAWHVLGAEQGAEIIMGLKPGSEIGQVRPALERGAMVGLLARVPAQAGDTFHLPAGMIHATGPGLAIFEIQQASDVTYRFYDWDRLGDDGKPRGLHIEKALEVMKPGLASGPNEVKALDPPSGRAELLVDDPHFRLIKAAIKGGYSPWLDPGRLRLLFILSGRGRINGLSVEPGQCWVLPAAGPKAELLPDGPGMEFLESIAL